MKKNIIAFDLDGGDLSSKVAFNAAKNFLIKNKEWTILAFSSDESLKIENRPKNLQLITTIDKVLPTDDSRAILRKRSSALYKAIDAVKTNQASAVVSAAASGPLVVAGYLFFKTINPEIRPAFSPIITKTNGQFFTILDVGANLDVTPETLNNYAIMGTELIKALKISTNPGVKLLNIGAEKSKGNELLKTSYKLLSENKQINFLGNIEPNYVLNDYDSLVIVTDPLLGNVLVKTMEGSLELIVDIIRKSIKESFLTKLGFLFAKHFRTELKSVLNVDYLGGAVVLGLNELIIKSHGRSNEVMYFNSLTTAKTLIEQELLDKIKTNLI